MHTLTSSKEVKDIEELANDIFQTTAALRHSRKYHILWNYQTTSHYIKLQAVLGVLFTVGVAE